MSRDRRERPLRVLLLTPFYPSVGDEVDGAFVAEPLAHLSRFNVETKIIAAKPLTRTTLGTTYKTRPDVPEAEWVLYPQLPGRAAYPTWGPGIYLRLARRVGRMQRARPFDLIHAHTALPCGYAAARLSEAFGIPYVITTHGLDVMSARRERGLSRRFCVRASRRVYAGAARNICVSAAVGREIRKGAGESARISVVYNGVDTETFRPPRGDERRDGSPPFILSVGRLIEQKGHETVLRAFAELAGRHTSLRHVIVDDGPESARLEAVARASGLGDRVEFAGRVSRERVAELMRRCTLFALPSRDEALGCVFVEAMATAKPVVAGRGEGIGELLRHGENGLLVQPDSPRETTQAVASLLEDASLRERLGRAALKTVNEGLTMTHHAAELTRVYRECLPPDDSGARLSERGGRE